MKSNPSCPFCCLILNTIFSQSFFSHGTAHHHNFNRPGQLDGEISLKQQSCGSYFDRERGVRVSVPQIVINRFLLNRIGVIYVLAGFNNGSGGEEFDRCLRGRKLREMIDTDVLKEWLRTCVHCHDELCRPASERAEKMSFGFRLIDVRKRCIVKISSPSKYAALSYV
jgi:hypothetical protein